MALFSLAIRTVSTTSVQSALSIIAGANTSYRLLEIGMTLNAATASCFGYGIPAAGGTTQSGQGTVQPEDAANTQAGATIGCPTWTTFPTSPTNFLRRVFLPATIGAGIVWTFPRGRSMLKATQDALYNISSTVSLADCWFVVDE